MSDSPAIHYLPMGPWPGFIGLAFSDEAFQAEVQRLKVPVPVKMLAHERADATLHEFTHPKHGCAWILALGPTKGRTKEQVAGLIAHEATHIVQYMREELGDLGKEGEAYIVQMVVQEALQKLWKSKMVRCTEPSGD